MRQKRQIQLRLSGPWPDHPFSRELAIMAAILDANPVIAELAWQDIVEGRSHQTGAPGLAAMAVVKAAVLQKVLGASFERLAFHLADSNSSRRFMGLGPFDVAPSASALQDNISRLSPRTWESINRVLVKWAQRAGIENGSKMRFDSTAVEADIHHPTDSSLLGDLVRVICRTIKKAGLPKTMICRDRRRVARRLVLKILNAKKQQAEKEPLPQAPAALPGAVPAGAGIGHEAGRLLARAEGGPDSTAGSAAEGHRADQATGALGQDAAAGAKDGQHIPDPRRHPGQ